MNFREQILSIIAGATPAKPLFVPRLDIWYNRNKERNTLPKGYETLSLVQVAEKLGVGFHSVVPDFIRGAPPEDIFHRGLGFYNHPDFPFRFDFSGVDFKVQQSENDLSVVYQTSKGSLHTRIKYGPELFQSGASIPDIVDHAIKEPEDYAKLIEVLAKIRVLPQVESHRAYRDRVGDRGVAVAFVSLAAGPMHHIMRDLRKFEGFCLDQYDYPDLLLDLCNPLGELHTAMLKETAASDAEVVLFGANYDDTITYAPFFDEHIAPWLNKAAEILHPSGKFLLTHTDGENQGLLSSFENTRFDIADSVCPAPMTNVSMGDYRESLASGVTSKTIWGGIPSIIMLKQSFSESSFRDYIDDILHSCKPYNRLILSIADTTPPDAEFDRIRYLCEQCGNGR